MLLVAVSVPATVTLLENTPSTAVILVALTLPILALPVTPSVVPTVAAPFTVKADTVVFPLVTNVVNKAVLGAALPIGVLCKPPSKSPAPVARSEPDKVIPDPLILPVTPSVVPIVALPVNVALVPLMFPATPSVVPIVAAPFTVNAATEVFPATAKVVPIDASPVNCKLPVLIVPYVPVITLPDSPVTLL